MNYCLFIILQFFNISTSLLQEAQKEIKDMRAKNSNGDSLLREIERLKKELKFKEDLYETRIKEYEKINEVVESIKNNINFGGYKEDWEKGLKELREEFDKQLEILRKFQKEEYERKVTDLSKQLQDAKEALLCCQGMSKEQLKCIASLKDEINVLEKEKFRVVRELKELEVEFEKEKSCSHGKLKAKEDVIDELNKKLEDHRETIRYLQVRTFLY